MREYTLEGQSIRSDNVVYATGAAAGLTQPANSYCLLVGNNVLKYRQDEILDTVKWLLTVAMASMDTTRFPRPAAIGGTFLRASLISTAFGQKWQAALVSAADMSTHPLTSEDSVYWGITGSALTLNGVQMMGSGGMDRGFEEIYQFYIQKFPEASA